MYQDDILTDDSPSISTVLHKLNSIEQMLYALATMWSLVTV